MNETVGNVTQLRKETEIPAYVRQTETVDPIIWGLTGSGGGVGVTSVAIQMAYRLANYKNRDLILRPRVALLELDFENSVLPHYLEIRPHVHAEALAGDPSRVDADLVETWMSPTPYGFSVFTTESVLNGNQKVNPDMVLAFLDNICGLYDYILLDIPRLSAPWTEASIGAADRVAIVSELTVPSLHLAHARAQDLLKDIEPLENVDFILNKFERRSFRSSLKFSDAERTLGKVAPITLSSEQVREAINRGEPVGSVYPDCRYVKDINALIQGWWDDSRAEFKAAM